jgi:regulator of sigma E protease
MLGVPQTGILYPRYAVPVVSTIEEGSAGQAAQLQKGDTFIALDGQEVGTNVAKIHEYINSHPDQTIQITLKRGDQQLIIPMTPASKQIDGKAVGTMGVLFEMPARAGDSFVNAFKNGCELTHAYIKATINGFKQIFSKGDVTKMSGPVSIVSIVMKGAGEGFSIFLLILAIISINLAVLNLIPLPILDGGQILFYTIEAIIRRPLSPKIREYIHIASWIFALALILFLSAQDIYRLIQPSLAKIGNLLGIK